MLNIPNTPRIRIKNVRNRLDMKIKILKTKTSLLKKNRDKIICTARKKKVFLPIYLTPQLAYFLGYLQGDGYLGSDKKTYGFADEYLKHLYYINKINKELFNCKGSIRKKRDIMSTKYSYDLQIRRNIINSYLHSIWGIPRGIKNNLQIPNKMCKNKNILKWYIKGLFDADGTLPKNPKKMKQPFIDLNMKDKDFIIRINKLINKKFEIKTLKLYCRIKKSPNSDYMSKTWEIRIRKHSEIKKFLKEIGFHHYNKQKRLIKLLEYFARVAQLG